MRDSLSFVVTGASGGVGSAVAQHLASLGHVVVNLDPAPARQPHPHVHHHRGDAGDAAAAVAAADLAESHAPLSGWVNNAAVFDDSDFATATPGEIGHSSP